MKGKRKCPSCGSAKIVELTGTGFRCAKCGYENKQSGLAKFIDGEGSKNGRTK